MRANLPIFASLLALLIGCGGSNSNSSNGSSETGGVTLGLLVGDAPTDELSSATVAVTEYRLILNGGGVTDNLLSAPRTLDVLGLGNSGSEALLDLVESNAGSFSGIRASIDPNSIELRDLNGDLIAVQVIASSDDASFATSASGDLSLAEGDFRSLSLDIDLNASLSSNGNGFDFELTIGAGHAEETPLLDDFTGQVTRINRDRDWFECRLVDARFEGHQFGIVRVEVEDEDLLFNFSGAEFGNSNAFLAALKVDDYVEIEGRLLRSGNFDAKRCEIEDRGENQVRMEGRILSVDEAGETFEFLLEEIEKGYALARPVLVALGDPGVLSIAWDNRTQFLGGKGSRGKSGPEDLMPGKKVDVRIDAANFNAPMPFLARSLRVDLEERYEGTVTDVAGLPGEFMLELEETHPSVNSGRITGPVSVELDSETVIFLDAGVRPDLAPGRVLTGMKLKIAGKLTGAKDKAKLRADRIEIEPGKMHAIAESFSATERQLVIVVSSIEDPFGDPEPNMTTHLIVPVGAILELDDEPTTFADLRTAFENLAAGEVLELTVLGIGDGSGNVTGYEIAAEID